MYDACWRGGGVDIKRHLKSQREAPSLKLLRGGERRKREKIYLIWMLVDYLYNLQKRELS